MNDERNIPNDPEDLRDALREEVVPGALTERDGIWYSGGEKTIDLLLGRNRRKEKTLRRLRDEIAAARAEHAQASVERDRRWQAEGFPAALARWEAMSAQANAAGLRLIPAPLSATDAPPGWPEVEPVVVHAVEDRGPQVIDVDPPRQATTTETVELSDAQGAALQDFLVGGERS